MTESVQNADWPRARRLIPNSAQSLNRPFARSSLMVQSHPYWDATFTVALPKQRQVKVDWYELLCQAFLYHVTGSCKGPIKIKKLKIRTESYN